MSDKGRLASNVLANVLQTLAGAGLLFALYRYINITLGVDQLGVWSVVLAVVSASRMADFGLSAGVVRFVARDRARGEIGHAGQVVDTATLALMSTVGGVLPLLYPLLAMLLPHLFDAVYLPQAQAILPYALASLWLTVIGSVFQGGLDGCQRMDLRAGLVVAGQSLLLILAFLLIPQHGLVGLAWAQIGQGLFLVVAGRFLLCRELPESSLLPRRWSKGVLREILGYGANIQVATVFMLVFDPVAKALMARFGGAAAAGFFEMASQVVLKARAMIVTANQAVVPHVAALAESEPERVDRFYRENMRVLAFVAFPAFALLIAWAGGVSWLLVGSYRSEFVFLLWLLAVSYGINIFAVPAYFINMGTGQVGWNTLSNVIMGAVNAGLAWLLGSLFGAQGVAFAYAIALIIGSGVLIVVFQRRHRVNWRWGIAHEHLSLAIACALVAALGTIEPLQPVVDGQVTIAAKLLLPSLVLGLAAWFHPMRRQLFGRLMSQTARP